MVKNSKSTATHKITPSSRRSKNPKSAFDLKNTKPSHRKSSIKDFRPDVRKLILGIVFANIIIVIAVIIAYFKISPQYQVPNTLDDLAVKYYENVFYKNLTTSDKYTGNPQAALEKYTDRGLSPISLRQILLQTKASDSIKSYLEKYCDTEATSFTFYPDEPFTRAAYHYKIDSSCEFE